MPSSNLKPVKDGVTLVCTQWRIFLQALVIPVSAYFLVANFGHLVAPSNVASFIATFIAQLVFTIIAVTTHRLTILGPDSVSKWGLNPIGWREFKFLLSQYVIMIFFIPLLLLFYIPFIGPFLALAAAAYMVGRLSLVFPSIAIDQKFDFRDSWDATREFQIMMFLTVVIFPLAIGVINAVLNSVPGIAYLVQIMAIVASVWIVASLSFAYRVIINEEGVF